MVRVKSGPPPPPASSGVISGQPRQPDDSDSSFELLEGDSTVSDWSGSGGGGGEVSGRLLLDLLSTSDPWERRWRDLWLEHHQLQQVLRQNNLAWQHQLHRLKKEKDNQELGSGKNGEKSKKKEKKGASKERTKRESRDNVAADASPRSIFGQEVSSEVLAPGQDEDELRLLRLVKKVDTLELERHKTSNEMQQILSGKGSLENELVRLKNDYECLRKTNKALVTEKWESSSKSTELQNRLMQQSRSFKQQGDKESLLQEELHKLQIALSEERKVTEKLSRNLELEKRRTESLEQKVMSANVPRSEGSCSSAALALPDKIVRRYDELVGAMRTYRMQCEQLGGSLEACQAMLDTLEIQSQYPVSDLRKELSVVKRLLLEEHYKSSEETKKLAEAQSSLAHLWKTYQGTVHSLQELLDDEEVPQQPTSEDSSDHHHHVDALTAKLLHCEERLEEEVARAEMLREKLRQMHLDVEAIPILKAQVEVYQSDFNAERAAREKIAGERADLEEQVKKLLFWRRNQQHQETTSNALPATLINLENGGETETRLSSGYNRVRTRASQIDESSQRKNDSSCPIASDDEGRNCPKCKTSFNNLRRLQAHVNDCLDRD